MQVNNEPVGMLRLTSFNARAQRDLAAAITSLEDQGAKVQLLFVCLPPLYHILLFGMYDCVWPTPDLMGSTGQTMCLKCECISPYGC